MSRQIAPVAVTGGHAAQGVLWSPHWLLLPPEQKAQPLKHAIGPCSAVWYRDTLSYEDRDNPAASHKSRGRPSGHVEGPGSLKAAECHRSRRNFDRPRASGVPAVATSLLRLLTSCPFASCFPRDQHGHDSQRTRHGASWCGAATRGERILSGLLTDSGEGCTVP